MAGNSSYFGRGATVTGALLVAVFVCTISRLLLTADQSNVANSRGSRVTSSLEFVIIVSRHGNRAPYTTCPKCPYKSLDTRYWPNGEMNLTTRGVLQMYQLGSKIRSLYDGFLDQIYYPSEFQANSTPVDRTLSSGEAFLAGLYPPKSFQEWNKGLLWQPIPVYPTYLDFSSYVDTNIQFNCPIYTYSENDKFAQYERDYESNMTSLLSSVQQYTGFTNTTSLANQIFYLWEGLFYSDNEGYPLPAWTSLIYPEPLESIMAKRLEAMYSASYVQIKVTFGLLFKAFIQLLLSKVEETADSDRKLHYLSGHDSTIMGLLGILGVTEERRVIKPGSAFIYELHRISSTTRYVVQILYIDGGSSDLEPRTLDTPNCGSPCSLYSLLNATEKYYNITNLTEECQLSHWIPSAKD